MVVMTLLALLHLAAGVGRLSGQEAEDCRDRASLTVTVLDESGTVALPGATIVLHWTDAVRRPVREPAAADGRFLICVPRDATKATLWAEFGDDSSEQAVVTFEAGEAREVELLVLIETVRPGRLVGRVHDVATGDPVATAAVSVLGGTRVVETNREGLFVFSGVRTGQHELEVRRLGYAPLLHSVEVTRGLTTEVEVGLVPTPVELDPLVATVTRPRRLEIKGFYERRYWGERVSGGTFFTAADIDRRRPLHISHMIADAPGIRLKDGKLVSTRMAATGFSSEGCPVNVYLDNIRISSERSADDISVDAFVRPVEIAGIEVYTGPSQLPAEFGGYDSRCGAIVIWTK